ncbi:MAG TPA: histidinol-phosphatase [Thermopetrobacter sp.]|nr:histidinol-phosphatase [Thermopetrobacter sp.]
MSVTDSDGIAALAGFALDLARAAGEEILPLFRSRGLGVDAKAQGPAAEGGFDPVTAADRRAEARMRAMIAAAHPDHGVRGEEMAASAAAPGCPWEWVLDPVDGTRAFVCGLPTWTTLIALLHEGRPLIGVIHQPFVGETFLGTPRGAWRIDAAGEKQQLAVRPAASLAEARAGTTLPDIYVTPRQRAMLAGMRARTRELRYDADAYFYTMVAAGHMDIAFDTAMQPFDVAALIPVVRGAGGVVCDWDGNPDPAAGDIIAASSPALLEEALAVLADD